MKTMLSEDFYIVVASLPDRENLVAEICFKGYQWVEISQETGDELVIQFYSHPKERYWEFPLDQALEALEQAKKKLVGTRDKKK